MQQVQNVFMSGLNKDSNPVSVDNKTLTDALNATTITFHGNEGLLQNDLGNTNLTYYPKVYNSEDDTNTDSDLCKLVSLPKGYIPIGMKEFGDIVYIISHNPISKKTEIGSFPGPDFDLPSVVPVEVSINKDIIGDYTDNIFSSPIVELKEKGLPELQVGDIITLKFDSNTAQYLSNNQEKKIFKLKLLNIKSNEDITDKLNLQFTNNGGEIKFYYPNIESGYLGAKIELEDNPIILYDGFKSISRSEDGLTLTLHFNDIKVQTNNYVNVESFFIAYDIINLDTNNIITVTPQNQYIYRQNGVFTISPVNINLPDPNFNQAIFKMTIIPELEYSTGNNRIDNLPMMHTLPAMYFEWDLRQDVNMINYKDITLEEYENVNSSYENIVKNRNLSYEINNFLQPQFTISDLSFKNKLQYFERKNLKRKDAQQPEIKNIKGSPDCLDTILQINNNKFRNQSNGEGSAAILWDYIEIEKQNTFKYTYPDTDTSITFDTYHTASLSLEGSIKPKYQQYIKTNLLGDLDNIFINNSKLIYPESQYNIGIITYPGGPALANEGHKRGDVTGYIGNWPEGNTRQSYGRVSLQINNTDVAEKFHNISIKAGAYNVGGEAVRDFSKVSSGIASFGKEIEAKVTPYLTNGKTTNITFSPSDFGNSNLGSLINKPIMPGGGDDWTSTAYTSSRATIVYKEKADALCWRSIDYLLQAESYTPDFGDAATDADGNKTEGQGANGLLVYPSIGGFTTETEMKPQTMEWFLDLEAKKIKLPENKEIPVKYNITYKYKNNTYYKQYQNTENSTQILINQNDLRPIPCQFLYNGSIVQNELTHNTILYNQYTSNPSYKLYNKLNTRYFTFACYSEYGSELINCDSNYTSITPDAYKIDGKSYYLHMYLIDSFKKEFKFNATQIIINPVIFQSNIYKIDGEQYYKLSSDEDIDFTNMVWTDPQLLLVDSIEIQDSLETGYYFDLGEDNTIKTSEDLLRLEEKYVYNRYFPDPIYYIKETKYSITNGNSN